MLAETFSIAIINSGCTETFFDEMWLHCIDSLSDSDKDKSILNNSNNSWKCGKSKFVTSNKVLIIPVLISGIQAKLTIDVIDDDVPWLLRKDSMKKSKAMIDFKNDEIIV